MTNVLLIFGGLIYFAYIILRNPGNPYNATEEKNDSSDT